MVYDDRGRLKSFGSVNYKINGLGQRLQKYTPGSKVRFMYNENGNLMGEYDGNDATLIEHVWLNGQIVGAMKPIAGAPDNFVTSYVTIDRNSGNPIVVNTAGLGDGSFFGPGYVARYVQNGRAYTRGEGGSAWQSIGSFSDLANELLWGRNLEHIIKKCKC